MRTLLFLCACLVSFIAYAGQTVHPLRITDHLLVDKQNNQLSIAAHQPGTVMQISISGPTGFQRFDTMTNAVVYDYQFPKDAPDGLYHYEVLYQVPTDKPDVINTRGDREPSQRTVRGFGSIKINNGVIVPSKESRDGVDLSQHDQHRSLNPLLQFALASLNWLISDVQAADLTITDPTPEIFFDDTQDEDCSPDHDWMIAADGGTSDTGFVSNSFQIRATREENPCSPAAQGINNIKFSIFDKGNFDTFFSIGVQSDGNVQFANSTFSMDKTNTRFGIGTISPQQPIEIQTSNPRILFDETSANSADYSIGEISNDFSIFIEDNALGGPIDTEALTLDSASGNFGLYHINPAALLTVSSPDNASAKILVTNTTGQIAPRTLLELRNPGNTKFSLTNTEKAVEWSFANPGTGFRVSRQGSGVVEFDFLNNGDLVIAGALTENSDRNAKTEIVDIDAQAILNKVTGLPIKQWQYKDALGENHIGPMAQDFYAAFGLGKDETGIATLDSSGVALAAIQALAEKYRQINHQNMALVEDNQYKRQRIDQLQQHVNQLLSDNQALKQSQREVLSAYHQQQATQNTQQRQLQQLQAHLQQLSQQLPQSLLTQQ